IYYPKVKAAMQGEDFETKGESINFANGKLKFKASKCNAGKWKVVSAAKTTADAAKTWVDTMLGVSSGGGTT
ncbi:MAG: hypothetical protein IK095_00030, partial [Oscillospiraceae bacterium]|nr:hypothetical protein [Oscillospiraceae bacterium]